MNGNIDDNQVDIEFGNDNNIECNCSSDCCFPWGKAKECVCPEAESDGEDGGQNVHPEADGHNSPL